MLKDSFCSSPWFHLRLTYDGSFEECRWYKTKIHDTNLADTAIMEFYNGSRMKSLRQDLLDGKKPVGCETCYYEESFGKLNGRTRQLLKSGIQTNNFPLSARSSPHYKRFLHSYQTQGHSDCYPTDLQIDLVEFWKQVKRIRKNDHTPALMFCTTKYGFDLYNSNPKEFRYDLVWDKQRGVSFLSANRMPMRSHEMIYVFSKAGANYNRIDITGDFKAYNFKATDKGAGMIPNWKRTETTNDGSTRCILSVIQSPNKTLRKSSHPTEKPIELYKFLIERYSNSGDTVLDPTFGSGNSGLTCIELNRKYIGIEKDNHFFWKFAKKVV